MIGLTINSVVSFSSLEVGDRQDPALFGDHEIDISPVDVLGPNSRLSVEDFLSFLYYLPSSTPTSTSTTT